MESNLVSVIVPIYNVEDFLKDCVDSIINQTYTNLEVILVDDGSVDNSGNICDSYVLKDKRVKVIHKVNGGLSDARNAGLDICNGDYIAFVDGDDIVSNKFIEFMFTTMKQEDVDIVSLSDEGGFWDDKTDPKSVLDENPNYETKLLTPVQALYNMDYMIIPTGIPYRLYKRSLFEKIRFPKGYLYEDVATSYKIIMLADSIAVISAKLYCYRLRFTSIIRREFNEDKLIIIEISDDFFNDSIAFDMSLRHAAACRVFSAISSVFLQAPISNKKAINSLWDSMKKYRKIILCEHNSNMRKKIWYCALLMSFGKRVTHYLGRKFGQKGSFR